MEVVSRKHKKLRSLSFHRGFHKVPLPAKGFAKLAI